MILGEFNIIMKFTNQNFGRRFTMNMSKTTDTKFDWFIDVRKIQFQKS